MTLTAIASSVTGLKADLPADPAAVLLDPASTETLLPGAAATAPLVPNDPLSRVALHKDVEQLARSPGASAGALPKGVPVLYSGKETSAPNGANTSAAAQASKIEAGRKVLIEAIQAAATEQREGNRASPQKAQVIELLYAFSVKYPADLTLMMPEIAPALNELLGVYGFKTWEQIGAQGKGSWKMEAARLDYAIGNFRRLSEQDRMLLEYGTKPASHFGINLMLTSAELQALESFEVSMPLPDGTKFRGTRAEYREASRNNINNHALAQITQIRSAGPLSLVGRAFAGEKGAAVGAMFDAFVDVGNAQKARVQVRSGVPTPTDTDYRTPIDPARRAPASPKSPADEGRPVTQGSQGIGHAPTQPAIAVAPTQPAAAGGNGSGGNGPGSTGPSGGTGSGAGSGPNSGSGSTGPRSNSSGTTGPRTADTGSGPRTADTGSGPRTADTTGSGSTSAAAQAGNANAGGGLRRSTYWTDPRRVTVQTAARGEQDMSLGEYRSRVEQAKRWISQQGPYDLGGPQKHMYDRAAEVFTLDRNWQHLGNPLLHEW